MTTQRPVIIWTEDGCWYQQTVGGVLRSSWLGKIGTPDEVREFCESRAMDFAAKAHRFNGTAIRERWPEKLRPG
jgi:hypothetical protein